MITSPVMITGLAVLASEFSSYIEPPILTTLFIFYNLTSVPLSFALSKGFHCEVIFILEFSSSSFIHN